MIVADTNLIAYLLIPGERTRYAEMAHHRDPEWVAPFLWRCEFRNLLALHVRRGLLPLDEALQTMVDAELLMDQKEFNVRSSSVLFLAANSRCSAYDCEFVTLAQEHGVKLVTSDQTVLSEFPSTAVSLENFVA